MERKMSRWHPTSLQAKSKSLARSSNFEPKSEEVIDTSFPYSEFWDQLLMRPQVEIDDIMRTASGAIRSWDENECYDWNIIRQGAQKGILARVTIFIPEYHNEASTTTLPKFTGRVSPRTLFFFQEFGYLRQVKPVCGNPACVNPYHQMTENSLEKPQTARISANHGKSVRIPVFNHDLTVANSFEFVHEAGMGGADWTKVKLIDFINMVVSHQRYQNELGREPTKYDTTIDVKCTIREEQ